MSHIESLKIDPSQRAQRTGPLRSIVIVSILAAVIGTVGIGFFHFRADSRETPTDTPQPPPSAVAPETIPAPAVDTTLLMASGYVVPRHKYVLGTKVAGRVEWVGIEEGDPVTRGQLLVKLEDQEYQARLDEAKAQLTAAELHLSELLAGSRPEEIERSKAELQRIEYDMANTQLEYERFKALLEHDAVSKQRVDDARTRFEMNKAMLQSARQSLALLVKGPREEQIAQARAKVDQARASVAYAQTTLDATEIRAPVKGTILRKLVNVGEIVATAFGNSAEVKTAAVVMADLSDLLVEIDVSQADFFRLSSNLTCSMKPEAYQDELYACMIDEISPEANRQKGSIQVKVKVLSPDHNLKPEMSATVTFTEKEKP
jgi:HlyD family secretion protein